MMHLLCVVQEELRDYTITILSFCDVFVHLLQVSVS